MEIFERQIVAGGVDDVRHRRKLDPRENVFIEPGIGRVLLEKADGVQHQDPLGLQAAPAGGEEIAVVAAADMLEHADRDDAVEGFVDVAVIEIAEFDRHPGAEPLAEFDLALRHGQADDLHPVMLDGVAGEGAPADADVEHAHSGFELQFAAEQFELVALRRRQIARPPPIAAGIGHVRVEHDLEQIVAGVVMALADLERAAARTERVELEEERLRECRADFDMLREIGAIGAFDQEIDALAIEPARHVGLAEADGALAQHALIGARIAHLQVPWPLAVDCDISLRQEIAEECFRRHRDPWESIRSVAAPSPAAKPSPLGGGSFLNRTPPGMLGRDGIRRIDSLRSPYRRVKASLLKSTRHGLLRAAAAPPAHWQEVAAMPQVSEVPWFSPRHIAFVIPLVLLHLACGLVAIVGASAVSLAVFVAASILQIFGITAGYHRLLAHRSFETSRAFQFFLATLGVLAGQNGPLWWIGHHRHHHRRSDHEGDIHSPRSGFLWSHMGWLFHPGCVRVRRHLVADLERFIELKLLERYSYAVNLIYLLLLYQLGEFANWLGAATNGWQLIVWGGIASTVCVYHFIWSANSFCHRYGRRRFPTRDDSRNNFVVSLLTMGDGWHNNHHRFPYSARHGLRWWELDANYAILRLLARLGIVWNLKLPPRGMRAARPA